ncbi:DUF2188 domain-containing protein [Nonomuraea sp. NPDC049625]|uniref:DUF2188 domain-containing protein n=1 Tax=Nonomuraea sp. NPDC049625 TaxID=3155775 RepID=UPI00343CAB4E
MSLLAITEKRRSLMAGQANSRDVVQRPDGSWAVTKPGGQRALFTADTQAAAVQRAGELLRRDGGGELRIHGIDGRVRDQRTIEPGNDPHPPTG